ncbi:MAG TPA: SRPBCC family protein [Solirubrobacterales bacterium]|nr:SRPBCC family protein [Solirubrobacterales bacterium]
MPLHAEAERSIDVPAATVYRLIADFKNHHPRFLPPKAVPDFTLEQGGVGAGTIHRVTIKAAGVSQTYRMRVDEPEPGRVLREAEIDGSTVTTYTVEEEGDGCRVRLETEWEPAGGLTGVVDRLFGPRVAGRLWSEVLESLDRYAHEHRDAATPGTTGG